MADRAPEPPREVARLDAFRVRQAEIRQDEIRESLRPMLEQVILEHRRLTGEGS